MGQALSLVLALAAVLLATGPAAAGSPTEELRGFFTAAAGVLDPRSSDSLETRFGAIRALVRDIVDVRGAAQLSLGSGWSARSAAEIDEFVPLFAELLEQSLIAGIAARIRLADGIQIRYLGESVEDTRATVSTTILSRRGVELSFDYRMIRRSGRWAIRDVIIDGVSLAGNYRAQFARVMQASSYAELLRQIRARIPAGAAAASAPVEVAAALEPPPDPGSAERDAAEPATQPEPFGARLETDVILTTAVERGALAQEPAPAEVAAPSSASIAAAEPSIAATESSIAAPRVPVSASTAAGAAPRPSERPYWVQVGAFRSVQSARRLAALVAEQERIARGGSSVVIEPGSAETPLSRVRIGPFAERSRAAAKLREVEARGFQPFIAEQRD